MHLIVFYYWFVALKTSHFSDAFEWQEHIEIKCTISGNRAAEFFPYLCLGLEDMQSNIIFM